MNHRPTAASKNHKLSTIHQCIKPIEACSMEREILFRHPATEVDHVLFKFHNLTQMNKAIFYKVSCIYPLLLFAEESHNKVEPQRSTNFGSPDPC